MPRVSRVFAWLAKQIKNWINMNIGLEQQRNGWKQVGKIDRNAKKMSGADRNRCSDCSTKRPGTA